MKLSQNELRPAIDPRRDHVYGPVDAQVTLVEYGDYECVYCRRAHSGIGRLRQERLGPKLRYVFRHLPNPRLHPHARLAAEAAEAAAAQGKFWEMHDYLFAHQQRLDRAGLMEAAGVLQLDTERFGRELDERTHARRIDRDIEAALESNATSTPTFFLNGHRYDGPWDVDSVMEAVRQPIGLKLRLLARAFAGLSMSTGLLMLLAVIIALVWANSPRGSSYEAFWGTELGLRFGQHRFALTLHEWVNDGLIVLFFFVVGLEIKREVLGGELAEPSRAALPVAAALGGMVLPAAIYLAFNHGGAIQGWGVPVATDTAFALALLTMLGKRAPMGLTIFVAALAIADDVGAILVLAFSYTDDISWLSLAMAALLFAVVVAFNRTRIYHPLPYALVGLGLWAAILNAGVHTTTAGVLLALVIPSRPSPSTSGLMGQSIAAFDNLRAPPTDDGSQGDKVRFEQTVSTLETVMERMLSPAQRLERSLNPWSSYLILPLFALANAGVVLGGEALQLYQPLALGIILALVIGKPLGITAGAWLATRLGVAHGPEGYSWRQLAGGSALCGIGFTMSIFIAGSAFQQEGDLALAKASAMAASLIAGVLGWAILRSGGEAEGENTDAQAPPARADSAAEQSA